MKLIFPVKEDTSYNPKHNEDRKLGGLQEVINVMNHILREVFSSEGNHQTKD